MIKQFKKSLMMYSKGRKRQDKAVEDITQKVNIVVIREVIIAVIWYC